MMLAYHNNPALKAAVLAELEECAQRDAILPGIYYDPETRQGSPVGCLIKGYDYSLFEQRYGIPIVLGRFLDQIYNELAPEDANEWVMRFFQSIEPGGNLELVGWRFQHWLVNNLNVPDDYRNAAKLRAAIARCAGTIRLFLQERPDDETIATVARKAVRKVAIRVARAAAKAGRVAERISCSPIGSVAESAALAMGAANAAAWIARAVANAVEGDDAIERTKRAALSCEYALEFAAESFPDRAAAWQRMAEKLLELIAETP